MATFELLGVFLAGALLGWLAGYRLGRVSETVRMAAAIEEARTSTARAISAESATSALRAELTTATERLTAAGLENVRLQAEATRVPGLEEGLSELRGELSTAQAVRSAIEARAEQIPILEHSLTLAQQQLREAEQENVRLDTQLQEAAKRTEEQLALLERAQTTFRETFEALSGEALRNNNQVFLEVAKAAMGEFHLGARGELESREKAVESLVNPIRESLAKYDAAVQELERNRVEAYSALTTQVTSLEQGQKELRSETGKLVKALHAPSPRGRWGEIQLRRVIEMAGMVEHCDFEEQAHVPLEEGRLRPDVIVHLPGTKTTVIDSKVPLTAYLDALYAENETSHRELLKDHAAQVRKHISQLASKAYWDQLPSSPDFVIMYVPLESAFAAALEQDPHLIDYAVESSVIPAGPMTLLTHLKAAAYGWRQERIATNAERISDLGKELYNRLATLAAYFADLGRNLAKATEAYNHAVGSLEHRVLVQARRFKDLGAAVGEELVEPEVVPVTPREIQAPELIAESAELATVEGPDSD